MSAIVAFIKAHYILVALGVGCYFLFRKRTVAAYGTSLAAVAPQAGKKITEISVSQDPGNSVWIDTNPANYQLADQSAYPGFYRSTLDGSWYNPDTGDFYSGGSSPAVANVKNAYDDGTVARPMIDLTTPAHVFTPEELAAPENQPGYIIY
jgi:hypothetical protein